MQTLEIIRRITEAVENIDDGMPEAAISDLMALIEMLTEPVKNENAPKSVGKHEEERE